MQENKIPNIPLLNFTKDKYGHYIFNSSKGKITFTNSNEEYEINDIGIEIYDVIKVSCKIKWDDYNELYSNNLNEAKLKCESQLYSFYFSIVTSFNGNLDPSKCLNLQFYEVKIIKNDLRIDENEEVKIWNILESNNISQAGFKEFEPNDLKEIYLKTINTIDYSLDNVEKRYNTQEAQKRSFNQLLNSAAFLFCKTTKQNYYSEVIQNIEKLLYFYDSSIIPIRMRILESINSDKLEIFIISKNTLKLKGESIFFEGPENFYNFLNSTYDMYTQLKNSRYEIDLLFHYYVWLKNEQYQEVELILSSSFIEVLTNDLTKSFQKNENKNIFKELKKVFNDIDLDAERLLEQLQPNIAKIIDDAKIVFSHENNKNLDFVCKKIKETYLLVIIEVYRNKIVHSGKFVMNDENIDKMINKKLIPNTKSGLDKRKQNLVEEIINFIGEELKYYKDDLFSINTQTQFFVNVIEIILLSLLTVDCQLINVNRFNCNNWLNTQEYLEQFRKNKHTDKIYLFILLIFLLIVALILYLGFRQ